MDDEVKLKRLWASNELLQYRLPDLKQFLKSVGLPMNGDAAKRVKMYLDVKYLDLFVLQDGQKTTPFELKQPQLRKIVAQLGMDPSGDKDELHFSLIEHLKKKNDKKDTASSSAGAGPGTSSSEPKGVSIAKQVLEMQDDYPAVLSVSGINITTDSSIETMRKAYLKISLLIHPDKLQNVFAEATKAFQCLVNAYERLSQPELFLEEEVVDKKKDKKIMRSNDGCHRTQIFCPRCKAEWGTSETGVEPYDYNFMMMGLKIYNCALCLFDFGCMSATHKCPLCRHPFDYHPNDFHRKIQCTNPKCKKAFGFFLFHVSDRIEREYRQEIRAKQEKQLKAKEQQEQRSKRAKSRGDDIGPKGKDKLFVLNLLDNCPKCGEEIESNYDLRVSHIENCNDKAKQAKYAEQLKREEEIAEKKKKLREAEEESHNLQSWDYLGAKTSEMWLLTEKQVQEMCKKYNIDTSDQTKDELIAKLVSHRNSLDSKRMITEGGGGEAPSAKKKKMSIAAEDLPSNLEAMTLPQLKSVCASFGIATSKNPTKAGIINQIEKLRYGDQPFLRLTDGKKK